MNKLIEKALENRYSKRDDKYSSDEIELALAWAEDKVSLSGVSRAIGGDTTGTASYIFLSKALAQYFIGSKK